MNNLYIKKRISLLGILMMSVTFAAAVLISTNYKQLTSVLSGGGGKASSTGYENQATIADMAVGSAASTSYGMKVGFAAQIGSTQGILPVANLDNTYVYPSPYKPGSGTKFDADYITFKKLTVDAEIKVFNIAGELVAEFEKSDSSVDYHQWSAENDAGEELASGVYIYYITNEAGDTAKGKFAIIK